MLLIIFIYLFVTAHAAPFDNENSPTTDCGEVGDCVVENFNCNNTIGFFYNDTIHDCVINIKLLLESLTTKYDTQDKIRLEVQRVFQGVIVAIILFVTCASLCLVSACIYCCRINYVDHRLKLDVEALAAKLNRDCNLKKPKVKTPPAPVSESCNMIVEGADVYVM